MLDLLLDDSAVFLGGHLILLILVLTIRLVSPLVLAVDICNVMLFGWSDSVLFSVLSHWGDDHSSNSAGLDLLAMLSGPCFEVHSLVVHLTLDLKRFGCSLGDSTLK